MKKICSWHEINPDQRESMDCADCNKCIQCSSNYESDLANGDECPFCHETGVIQ